MRRKFLAPEVIQTSAVDCGPAALKSILGGFNIRASFGRLREACQTQLDGTSIDSLEDIAGRLGLDVEQVVIPLDHVFLKGANLLPAIAVANTPSGMLHFIVLWRRFGRWVQVMDPQVGRRWVSIARLTQQLHVHSAVVESEAWRAWAGSPQNRSALTQRANQIGIKRRSFSRLLRHAFEDAGWKSLALLDGALRMVTELTAGGGIRQGSQAKNLLRELVNRAEQNGIDATVPGPFRSVLPVPGDETMVSVKGAVLLTVLGRRAVQQKLDADESEIEAILSEPDPRPLRTVIKTIFAGGFMRPFGVIFGLIALAAFMIVEAILLRGLLSLTSSLTIGTQRLVAGAMIIAFFLLQASMEFVVQSELLRLGRALELRMRMRFLSKIRTLALSYFQSRPSSDLADRCHNLHNLRIFPAGLGQIIRSTSVLCATTCGLLWLVPEATTIILSLLAIALVVPLALQSIVSEQDLRFRTQSGALTRFYLDSLLGLVPIRSHSAERSVLTEHEAFLVDWRKTGMQLLLANISVQTGEALLGIVLAMTAVTLFTAYHAGASSLLLLAFWALSLPGFAQNAADALLQYPALRSIALRLLEPLGAPDEAIDAAEKAVALSETTDKPHGVAIAIRDVVMRAGGRVVLEDINLEIAAGSQVAIVGHSGSGKSSLVGLLLGWRKPSSGSLLIDNEPFDPRILRRQTAWIDPSIQLWNRSLFDNIDYGAIDADAATLSTAVTEAELTDLIGHLSDGMQTVIGENGAMTSGGEGQRVRLARAKMRPTARLVVLDEAFRGLDRAARRRLLQRARTAWPQATLLCVTHDVGETLGFERVLVLEDGVIAEDGDPKFLAEKQDSLFRVLHEAEQNVDRELWGTPKWQRWFVRRGGLETAANDETQSGLQGVPHGVP